MQRLGAISLVAAVAELQISGCILNIGGGVEPLPLSLVPASHRGVSLYHREIGAAGLRDYRNREMSRQPPACHGGTEIHNDQDRAPLYVAVIRTKHLASSATSTLETRMLLFNYELLWRRQGEHNLHSESVT